jgi:ATP-dependent DNA helicase DinG
MPNKEAVLAEISRETPEQFRTREGFVMNVYGCSVFEEYIDGYGFKYTAVSDATGKEALIERRARPLPPNDDKLAKFVLKVRDSRVGGLGRYEVASGAKLAKLKDIVRHIFQDVLPNAKADYKIREEQIALAEDLLEATVGRRTLLAEAPTGLGKTLAYLIVGLLVVRSQINRTWNGGYFPGMSCVEWERMGALVSTSSIALQKSIRAEVLPELSQILLDWGIIREPITAVLRKGKLHYVCEYKLSEYLPFEPDAKTRKELERIALDESIIDLAEVDGLTTLTKGRISVPPKCFKNCPHANYCRYRAFLNDTKNSGCDFTICNHQLLLADMKLRSEDSGAILQPFQFLVLDEAHKVLPAARSLFGAELEKDTIPTITLRLTELNFTPLAPTRTGRSCDTDSWVALRGSVRFLANKLYEVNKRLFNRDDCGAECDHILVNVRDISERLIQLLQASQTFEVERDEQCKHHLIYELRAVSRAADELFDSEAMVRWYKTEDEKRIGRTGRSCISGIPKDLDERLYAALWSRGIPALLTSGTLSVGGDFTAMKHSLGLDNRNMRLAEVTHSSPFNYKENCLLYLTENVPDYRASGYAEALTDEIERLLTASHGHAAVLFTSYRTMHEVHRKLKNRMPEMKDFVLERSTSTAIERFKASGNGVLFASGSFAEGVDCPGDILSMLIIVKLPFERPSEITRQEQTKFTNFKAYFDGVLMPDMLIKLKQNIGRGFRQERDTCVVAICDARVAQGQPFREQVIAALPKCDITDSLDVVAGFYPAKKAPAYFL